MEFVGLWGDSKEVVEAFFVTSFSFKSLTEEEKTVYAERARKWNSKRRSQKTIKEVNTENGTPSVRRSSKWCWPVWGQFRRMLLKVSPALSNITSSLWRSWLQ